MSYQTLEKVYLECVNTYSNKFYEIEILQCITPNVSSTLYLNTRYGAIGTKGVKNEQPFAIYKSCKVKFNNLLKQKLNKKYIVTYQFAIETENKTESIKGEKELFTLVKAKRKEEIKEDIKTELFNRLDNLDFED